MPAEHATRASWKNQPLPDARAPLAYTRTFDAQEHARVTKGLVPEEMEDKWFIFYEAPWLFLHRSWTGTCIYAVRLRAERAGSVVEEALVNRAPEQYRETDDSHDLALLAFLVERLLLGRVAKFPVRRDLDATKAQALFHHVAGHGRSNEEE
jgi:hypothetical protein